MPQPSKGLLDTIRSKTAAVQSPPRLRMAGADGRSCATCQHFAPSSVAAGRCQLYGGYPVRPGQVCDSFQPRGRSGQEPGPQ